MEINFPLRELITKEITPNQFTIGIVIHEKRLGFLRDLKTMLGEDFSKEVESMRLRGYLHYNVIGTTVPLNEIQVTSKFINLITLGNPFSELFELFPREVTRPDGKKDNLKTRKAKCMIKYSKILSKNPMLHIQIIKALEFELNYRKENGSMGYMRRLYNWLENEEWKIYERMLSENVKYKNKLSDPNRKETYGTGLL